MHASRLKYLFMLYVNRECTSKEMNELMNLISDPVNDGKVLSLINTLIENTESEMFLPDDKSDFYLPNILRPDKKTIASFKIQYKHFGLWKSVSISI